MPENTRARIVSWMQGDTGEDVIEYAALAGFISIVAVATVRTIGPLVEQYFLVVVPALTP